MANVKDIIRVLREEFALLRTTAINGVSLPRSGLITDEAKPYILLLDTWRVTGTGALLGASAGTPAGAFGITYGTLGTASPKIVSEAASGNTKTNKMRRSFPLPPEYVSGQPITVRVRAKEEVGAATVSTTVDVKVYKTDKEAGIGSDICATDAIDVTTAVGNKDFTVTPTGLVAGDVLDIEVTGVVTDTGGTVGTVLAVYDVAVLLDIKG